MPIVLLGSLLATPVKETVWWDTPGGRVMEHRDQTTASCSLTFYDEKGSVTFEWDRPGKVLVTATNGKWQFRDDRNTPVAMQVGNVWLSNHDASVVIEAVGHGNGIAFATDQAVVDLLQPADHIVVRTTKADMSIVLNRDKLGTLLTRLRKCRDATGR